MRPSTALAAGLLLAGLALLPPGSYSVDGASMLAVADSLVSRGSFAVSCSVGIPGRGGECFSVWYPLLSIVLTPFAAAGRLAAHVASLPPGPVQTVVALLVPLLASVGCARLAYGLSRRLGATVLGAGAAAVGLYFGTELWTYSRTLYAEPLAALLVATSAWGMLGTGRRRAIGCAAIALAILAKPQMGLAGLGIAAGLAWRDHSLRPLLWAGAATAVGALVYLLYNELRFGDFLDFGGEARTLATATGSRGGPEHPLPVRAVIGAGVLLVSPENGLLLYSPVAALGAVGLLTRIRSRTAAACLGGALGVFAAYVLAPYGGNWGTRYLVPALPLLAPGLGVLRGTLARVAVVLACLTAISQLPNLAANYERFYREAEPHSLAQGRVVPQWDAWNPHPQLFGVWSSARHQVEAAADTPPDVLLRRSERPGENQEDILQTVNQWWWMLPTVGLPAWLGFFASLLLLAAGAALLALALSGGVIHGRWPRSRRRVARS